MSLAAPKTRHWSRAEYYRMGDLAFFENQRVELIGGEIIEMAPQRNTHAAAVSLTAKAVERAFGAGHWVRQQSPLSLAGDSEPEPDACVVRGTERDYPGDEHPSAALLVVEISDTTLRFDRGRKASLYAAAGIADYWILNLVDRQLEIHRKPVADPAEPHGHRYAEITVCRAHESVAPLAAVGACVSVADMLP